MTRWTTDHAMGVRLLHLCDELKEYFSAHNNDRALSSEEWQLLRETVSVLNPAMEAITRIQGGEVFFVSEAINLCSTLHKSFAASDQEIRSANRFDGPAISIPVLELRNPICLQLDILLKQMESRTWARP